MPRTREYQDFTPEAAARIAEEFKVIDHTDVIFKNVAQATETYKRYRKLPDYHQTKDASIEHRRLLRVTSLSWAPRWMYVSLSETAITGVKSASSSAVLNCSRCIISLRPSLRAARFMKFA
jgi:hypothetical protein